MAALHVQTPPLEQPVPSSPSTEPSLVSKSQSRDTGTSPKTVNYRAAVIVICILLIAVGVSLAIMMWDPVTVPATQSPIAPLPFYCVYTPVNGSTYTIADIPQRMCKHIVYCCIRPISGTLASNQENMAIVAGAKLRVRDGHFVRYLGAGSHVWESRRWVDQDNRIVPVDIDTIDDFNPRTAQVKAIRDVQSLGDYNGGVALFVRPMARIPTPSDLYEFLNELLGAVTNQVLVFLPHPWTSTQNPINLTQLVSLKIKVVLISNEVGSSIGREMMACPSPHSGDGDATLVSAFKFVEKQQQLGETNLSRKIAFTSSVKVLHSWAPAGVIEVVPVPYKEFCTRRGKPKWPEFLDTGTACVVIYLSGYESYTVLDPVSNKFLREYGNDIGGVVVFDIDLDDYEGACGIKNPLLSMLYDASTSRDRT